MNKSNEHESQHLCSVHSVHSVIHRVHSVHSVHRHSVHSVERVTILNSLEHISQHLCSVQSVHSTYTVYSVYTDTVYTLYTVYTDTIQVGQLNGKTICCITSNELKISQMSSCYSTILKVPHQGSI